MPIKTRIKQASGWLYFKSPKGRAELRGAGVILMLHRVLADDASAALPHRNELCVGPKAFEGLLRWLPRHFDCVGLMDLLDDHAAPRRDGRPKVAIANIISPAVATNQPHRALCQVVRHMQQFSRCG